MFKLNSSVTNGCNVPKDKIKKQNKIKQNRRKEQNNLYIAILKISKSYY